MSDNGMLITPYGAFAGAESEEYYPGGAVKSIRLNERNVIITHAGELIPFYHEETQRRKYKPSVTFHENGMIRAVALEEQQEVNTPVGGLPAEFVTFYDTGELKRVFPLDGKISGFWSEEDERYLNIPLSFDLGFTQFTALLTGICFYKSGSIKSITLFPREEITVTLPQIGDIAVRNGFSLFETGELRSLEPLNPVPVRTPIGTLNAYDISALGLNADSGSLSFDIEGRVTAITTSNDSITAIGKDSFIKNFAPEEVINPDNESEKLILPFKLTFDYISKTAIITNVEGESFKFGFSNIFVISRGSLTVCAIEDCKNCKLCSGCDK